MYFALSVFATFQSARHGGTGFRTMRTFQVELGHGHGVVWHCCMSNARRSGMVMVCGSSLVGCTALL